MCMTRIALILALFSPAITLGQVTDVDYSWQTKRDKDGIVIRTSAVAGSSFKAVRGEMVVNASVLSLVALVEDLGACAEWADLCKEARVEQRVSDSESFVYLYNDVPFPVSDRDVYTHVTWTIEPETKRVTMVSKAVADGTPHTKAVRIEKAISQWHFTPLGDGSTKVESFAHIDPNGPTPAWITNLLLVDSPFKSMQNMRDLVESGVYQESEVPFLEGY